MKMNKYRRNDIEHIVCTANKLIDEGKAVSLYNSINGIILCVFVGKNWFVGNWETVERIECDSTIKIQPRMFNCVRKFIYNGKSITLTACTVEHCFRKLTDSTDKLLDYKPLCNLKI